MKTQNPFILDNLFGLNLKFKMSQDSLSNLYEIKPGSMFDSISININGKAWNLERYSVGYIMAFKHEGEIHSFLHSEQFPDSVFTVLDFYSGKLVKATIYFKGAKRIKEAEMELMRYFKTSKPYGKMQNKTTKTYFGINESGYSILVVSDKKAMDFVPPWCGNDRRRGSWPKLKKYLSEANYLRE